MVVSIPEANNVPVLPDVRDLLAQRFMALARESGRIDLVVPILIQPIEAQTDKRNKNGEKGFCHQLKWTQD
jgi:hypothetical protein